MLKARKKTTNTTQISDAKVLSLGLDFNKARPIMTLPDGVFDTFMLKHSIPVRLILIYIFYVNLMFNFISFDLLPWATIACNNSQENFLCDTVFSIAKFLPMKSLNDNQSTSFEPNLRKYFK